MSAASLLEGLDASTLATLERNDIRTVEDLQALSEGDVQELGLSIGHRNQLQKRIAAARKPEPTERTPLAGASIIADGSKKEPTERTPLAGASIIGDREYVGDGSKKAGVGVWKGVCICLCIAVGLVGGAFLFTTMFTDVFSGTPEPCPSERDCADYYSGGTPEGYNSGVLPYGFRGEGGCSCCTTSRCHTCQARCPEGTKDYRGMLHNECHQKCDADARDSPRDYDYPMLLSQQTGPPLVAPTKNNSSAA